MTVEALGEVERALKSNATKNTSVACFQNQGTNRMVKKWCVGNCNNFTDNGHFAAGHTTLPPAETPAWIRLIALLSKTAGMGHDFGKAVNFFQNKLTDPPSQPKKDLVRHEWLSMKLAKRWIDELAAGTAPLSSEDLWSHEWNKLGNNWMHLQNFEKWKKGFTTWDDSLLFLIATHHKLFDGKNCGRQVNSSQHVRQDIKESGTISIEERQVAGILPKSIFNQWESLLGRLSKNTLSAEESKNTDFWRGVTILSRAALILADHDVSSRPRASSDHWAKEYMYAKSGANNDLLTAQSLPWHLENVSKTAGSFAWKILMNRKNTPALSDSSVETIIQRSDPSSRFSWQDIAYDTLSSGEQVPTIVINQAGTGCGKTRMNAKAVCAIAHGRNVRFTTALNLRTLTLQTHDSYSDELKIPESDLRMVIGDDTVKIMHSASWNSNTGNEDTEDDEGESVKSIGSELEIPKWIVDVLQAQSGMDKVIASPVLVSTVDTIIKAGEPGRQGKHASQLLRLATSDIILDEIDSFDQSALVAVLRLVMLSGLFGRSVIASSATLPEPTVSALIRSYEAGIRIHKALGMEKESSGKYRCAIIDEKKSPDVIELLAQDERDESNVLKVVEVFAERVSCKNNNKINKLAKLIKVDPEGGIEGYHQSIIGGITEMHDYNHFEMYGKRVSVGLIRCANIKPTIAIADLISSNIPHARVACYHSTDFMIQRIHKEKRLDTLLKRSSGNENLLNDPEISDIVKNTDGDDVQFIVVATPVEEVGRDHDFDWAIIEPSSVHSIIQTAGRVNRHRMLEATKPNIGILQFNINTFKGGKDKKVFIHPGLEISDSEMVSHPEHDLQEILIWDEVNGSLVLALDSTVRYKDKNGIYSHDFSKYDDLSLAYFLDSAKKPLSSVLNNNKPYWATKQTYDRAQLRSFQRSRVFILSMDDSGVVPIIEEEMQQRYGKVVKTPISFKDIERRQSDWLVLSPSEMVAKAKEFNASHGADMDSLLSCSIADYRNFDEEGNCASNYNLHVDFSFGLVLHNPG
jgi:CRISPR-associated endonuclease/helicase Cas3